VDSPNYRINDHLAGAFQSCQRGEHKHAIAWLIDAIRDLDMRLRVVPDLIKKEMNDRQMSQIHTVNPVPKQPAITASNRLRLKILHLVEEEMKTEGWTIAESNELTDSIMNVIHVHELRE
jgi:hypothetical protein